MATSPATVARARRDRPRTAALLALAAIGTAAALVAAELGARAFVPGWAPRSARMTAFWQYDSRYGWSHVPNTSGRFVAPDFDVHVRINSRGFRGPVVPYARRPGARRLVALGDSHVWGFGVEEDRGFCRLLEGLVPDLEVVNLGVSGYSTDQELLLYRDEGHRYDADIVMIVVAHNDLRGNTRTVESTVYGKPRFVLVGDDLVLDNHPVPRPAVLERLLFDFSARSYLLTGALRTIDQSRRDSDVATGPVPASELTREQRARLRDQPFPWSPAHRVTARLLLELHRQVAARPGAPELFVVLADLRNGLGQEVADYLARFGVAAVALDTHVDPVDPAWHLQDGLHWTEAGHRRVAEVLADAVTALLDRRAPEITTARPAAPQR